MLLKLVKAKLTKINFFKSLGDHFTLLVLCLIVLILGSGFEFKGNSQSFLKDLESKIKVKINYTESPNKTDFFTKQETGNYLSFGNLGDLEGAWAGSYTLDKSSIFWTNPDLDSLKIYNSIKVGPYNIYLKFNVQDENKLNSLIISQEDVKYDSVNLEIANDKQINYWAKAISSNWFEIVRGKIFKVSDNELFTIFQTTVYEKKIPIYAFQGVSLLKKSQDLRTKVSSGMAP